MRSLSKLGSFLLLAFASVYGVAQGAGSVALPSPTPQLSLVLAQRAASYNKATSVTIEARSASLAKLLEGQRHAWAASRTRSGTRASNSIRLAREAFRQALEIDPGLAEAYTALAELEISLSPSEASVDEAIALAAIAVRIDEKNFGSRRLLARLFSYKSRLATNSYDREIGAKAIAEWKEVVEMDPRNAEGWAFLSAFYERLGEPQPRIDALQKWVASAAPIDTQFYRLVLGPNEDLSSDSASMKLGPALLQAGRVKEAIETMSLVIAENPDNTTAIEILRDAVESATGDAASSAVESLQQAVYANPTNISLLNVLARVYSKTGRLDEGVAVIRSAAEAAEATNPVVAAPIWMALGDFLIALPDRATEAEKMFQKAIDARGVRSVGLIGDSDREFAMEVIGRLVRVQRQQNKERSVRQTLEFAAGLFGPKDLFSDRLLITYLRETGQKADALATIRSARKKAPGDVGLFRLEATLLTELGRVDEAVGLVEAQIKAAALRSGPTTELLPRDEFSDLLFISSLYSQAGRGKDAAAVARRAFQVAQGTERKVIANLTLATALNTAGDFAGAEATLREILKQTPRNPIALNNLGYFLLERDERLEEAREMIDQAVKIDPTNPSFLDSLGWAYYKLGDLAKAELYLKEAARYDSASSTIQEHLGDVYQKLKMPELAKAAWHRALLLATAPADVKRIEKKLGR